MKTHHIYHFLIASAIHVFVFLVASWFTTDLRLANIAGCYTANLYYLNREITQWEIETRFYYSIMFETNIIGMWSKDRLKVVDDFMLKFGFMDYIVAAVGSFLTLIIINVIIK